MALGDQADHLVEGGHLFGQRLFVQDESGPPLVGLEHQLSVELGHGTPQPHQAVDALGNHHINGQRRLQPILVAQLQPLDPAALLENQEEQLDFPARAVPVDQLCRVLQRARLPVG